MTPLSTRTKAGRLVLMDGEVGRYAAYSISAHDSGNEAMAEFWLREAKRALRFEALAADADLSSTLRLSTVR